METPTQLTDGGPQVKGAEEKEDEAVQTAVNGHSVVYRNALCSTVAGGQPEVTD